MSASKQVTKKDSADKYLFWVSLLLVCIPFMFSYKLDGDGVYTPVISNPLGMDKGLIWLLGMATLLFVLMKFVRAIEFNEHVHYISIGLSVFFAICMVFGKSFESIASWDYVFGSRSGFLLSICSIAGYAIILYYFIRVAFKFIFEYNTIIAELSPGGALERFNNWLSDFFQNKSFLKFWLIIMSCWFVFALINYPGIIHYDSGRMLRQHLAGNYVNHDPVLQAVFLGNFFDFGLETLGSYERGMFLFVLLQLIYGSFISALLLNFVHKKKYPITIIFVSLCIFAVGPIFARHAISACKDSNFTFYTMLAVWTTLMMFDHKDGLLKKKWFLLPLWIFAILLVCFSRKNGVYVILPMAVFSVLYLFFKSSKQATVFVLLSSIIGFGIYFAGESYIEEEYGIKNFNIQISFSIPFQQTARYIRDYGDEVTVKEREAINAVLDYDVIAERYNPELSDPVMLRSFRNDATDEELQNYLKVWFRQLLNHPTVYIQATLNNMYGYFYPDSVGYYKEVDYFYDNRNTVSDIITRPEGFSYKIREFQNETRRLPVIGLVSSVGFFIWINLFVTLFYLFFKKDKRFIICNTPCLMTMLICVASPVCTIRYALPIMFLTPIMLCMCFPQREESKNQ